jgi:adenine-specific DNA-methyltransferase
VFKPLLDYIEGERLRAGVSKEDINEALGFRRMGGMAGRHYFSMSQWCLPTAEHYQKMRECLSNLNHGGEYLKRDYEDLKRDYEDLRRPFSVSADVPYTDVWTFKTVSHYAGKHPCEKPLEMLEHIIRTSSKEGATVLDCFMGTGNTGRAAVKLNRSFIGIEKDAKYFGRAEERITQAQMVMPL